MLAVAAPLIQAGVAAAKTAAWGLSASATLGSQDVDRLASPYPAASAAAWAHTSWGSALALGGFLSPPCDLDIQRHLERGVAAN